MAPATRTVRSSIAVYVASVVSRVPGWLGDQVRVRVLVERVRGDRVRGEPGTRVERRHVEVVLALVHQEPVGAGRDGAGRSALDRRGRVPGQSGIGPVQVGIGGEQRAVRRAPGQHDVGPRAQRGLDRLDPIIATAWLAASVSASSSGAPGSGRISAAAPANNPSNTATAPTAPAKPSLSSGRSVATIRDRTAALSKPSGPSAR
jgi:hypothetical protein